MGHIRLSRLTATRKWRDVVAMLDGGESVAGIAAATLDASGSALARAMGVDRAASAGLADAAADPGLVHALWLLTQVTQAARAPDLAAALGEIGLRVPRQPGLFDITAAFADSVDRHGRRQGGITDIGEIARLAAVESLTALSQARAPTLYEPLPSDMRGTLRQLSTKDGFATLAEDCFARFTRRFLLYHLSRELSDHVGPGRRFTNLEAHTAFNEALDTHCREVARIVREFAGGWYSKENFEGGITSEKARAFAYVAFKKILEEMKRR